MTEKYVVAQHKARRPTRDESRADGEGLRQALGPWLDGVGQILAPLRPIAEQVVERCRPVRGRDDQHIANFREHQSGRG